MAFLSYFQDIRSVITQILSSPILHAKWINTLSYMENCGARKIAACEHPRLVKEEILKHASEEFRHAHYLKKQISRVTDLSFADYSKPFILGGFSSFQYLTMLDLLTCRYIHTCKNLTGFEVKEAAYLLVTYAIEKRAEELYPIYDEALRTIRSKVTVKSILLEEKEHLAEMEEGLNKLPEGFLHAQYVCKIESSLCSQWLNSIRKELNLPTNRSLPCKTALHE